MKRCHTQALFQMRFILKVLKRSIKSRIANGTSVTYLPLAYDFDVNRINFLHKLVLVDDSPIQLMMTLIANEELQL